MLTPIEKVLFILGVVVSGIATFRAAEKIIRIIKRGESHNNRIDWRLAKQRLFSVLGKTVSLQPTFRLRFGVSSLHALIAWGFIYYLVVNTGDVLQAFIPGFHFLGQGVLGNIYRLGTDVSSTGVLVGMAAMLVRRFVLRSPWLTAREDVLLHPQARTGIQRDSMIVGFFILVHVGARFLGQAFVLAGSGSDPWQPFASAVASALPGLWQSLNPETIIVSEHAAFWLALGAILGFMPYFLYSKHLHLVFAPLNFLLKPERRSTAELSKLNFDDESIEQFGATKLEHLGWEQLMDAYACIMCYRCQQVCPAYETGKVLSPAALEINKRYFLNTEGASLARGEQSSLPLTEFAISQEAVWACTACGACVDICPVGNEPMRDILDIRRSLVLMENSFPEQLQAAFKGLERNANPWNISPSERMRWADGLYVPTIEQQPQPELLWWVGCAPAFDVRAQKTAQAFAKILNAAGVNYAVLGQLENCTGDAARRAGNEFLFNELALANVELLNQAAPKRIVTTCPHCYHTLKNEHPAFGGFYDVIHHTQLIEALITKGDLKINRPQKDSKIAFHDPCYLGRHNQVLEAPRRVLKSSSTNVLELPRHGMQSFCCGAGGAQMWKEEENGSERISANRLHEVQESGAELLAVGCPFCLNMLDDARKDAHSDLQIQDIAEIIAAQIA